MQLPVMGYIASFSTFVPAITGIVRYKGMDKSMKLFTTFAVFGVVSISLEYLLALTGSINYVLSDIYFLVQVPLFGLIYYSSIPAKAVRSILTAGAFLFVVVWLIIEVFFRSPDRLSSVLAMIAAIFLVVMSSLTLHAVIKSSTTRLSEIPMFWILTGTILYSAGSFAVMGLSNELLSAGLVYFIIGWHINWALYTVSMLMYAKGLLCKSVA